MINIAVVVPVHNRREITLHFLQQMLNITPPEAKTDLIVIDDGSTDGTSDAIRLQYPDVIVLHGDGNLWWTGAVKMGALFAMQKNYDAVLIMNDDLELDKDFLVELLKVAGLYPDALVSSIKLNRQNNGKEQIITAGFRVTGMLKETEILHADEPYRRDMKEVLECDQLTGSSLLIPVNVFHQIGTFDEKNFPHGYGDFEFTRRASLAGFKCLVATRSRVYTEYNSNYTLRYLIRSSRKDYLKNLFSSTKYSYGFTSLRKLSYMHKNFFIGTILYLRRLLGLARYILMKIILPNRLLRMLVKDSNLIESSPETASRKQNLS
jgi:GT2 family glycosyltransferase